MTKSKGLEKELKDFLVKRYTVDKFNEILQFMSFYDTILENNKIYDKSQRKSIMKIYFEHNYKLIKNDFESFYSLKPEHSSIVL